jgi:glycosyltransferase involved in cell wall biosynthesis
MISVIVPIFNEEGTARQLHGRIVDAMNKQPASYEIIFVNDGSTDGTLGAISDLRPLKIVSLQRNYGQTPALDVGIQEARGDILVFLDADLQNDPAEILGLLQKLSTGCDVVVGRRQNRKDVRSRILFSYVANRIARFVLGVQIHDFGCGLKVYRSKFIKDFRLWGDVQVFLPAIAKERGAIICEVPISSYARTAGISKIKITNMIRGGFDLLSIMFFVKYFSRPLRFFGGWGIFSILLAVIAFGAAVILKLFGIKDLTVTPLPTVGVLFAITGVLLFMMGLLAEILLRIYYVATNNSPYFIRQIKENL